MSKLQKNLLKTSQTSEIEKHIIGFKIYQKDAMAVPNEVRNYFIEVDYSEVKRATIDKAGEWLSMLGELLIDMSNKELGVIVKDIDAYEKQLNNQVEGIEGLKHLLNVISEIKNRSMDMEFRIHEV